MPEQPVYHSLLVAEEGSLRVYYAQDDGGNLRREEFRPRFPGTIHETVQQAIALPSKDSAPQAGEASGLPFSTT
jgi:hypothetical protein